MKNRKILFSFLLIILFSSFLIDQNSEKITIGNVKTQNGLISGVPGTDPQVLVFKSIPFAEPPVGDLRWKEPQSVQNWQGVKECNSFGPNAMQNNPVSRGVYTTEFLIPADGKISEDCLYLNVWTTAKTTKEKRPVIVYIHGGGFSEGSGSVPIYDGESMAKKDVVFVTINYRLGIFGFFAHPELTRESTHKTSGNYGILDQIAALKWVKNNIVAFGGNPDNVTIAGQSAGAMSVNALSATPLSKGLFNKIIAESGASVVYGMFGGTDNLQKGEEKGVEIAKKIGAITLKELRNMSASEIQKAAKGMMMVIADGYVIPEPIPEIFAKGKQADVPLLTGWNADDALFSAPATLDSYREGLKKQFGSDVEKIMKVYPANNDDEATIAQKSLSRDMGFGIQNYAWARIQSEKGKSKSYLYFFERKIPEVGGATKYGAFHSGEITYAYDNHKMFNRPWEPADHELAKLMSSYWVNFATKGDPNGTGLPLWSSFNKNSGEVMSFNVKSAMVKHPSYDALEYFFQKAMTK